MLFNISFDQAVNSLPTGFVTAVNYVTSYFGHLFKDNITVNIHVGYGEVGGQQLGSSALGSSLTFLNSFSYASIRNALTADAKSPGDNTSVASLLVNDPIGSPHAYWLSIAEQRALGLRASVDGQIDGYVGFSSTFNFDYNRNDGITAGFYDFIGVVEHEFSEVMGRVVLAGQSIGGGPGFEPLDLFDYSSAGVRRLIGTNPGYFSIDGGVTNLNNFNTNPGGDFGDWAASAGNDAGLAFSSSSVLNNYSGVDVLSLDVLGYDRAPTTTHDFSGEGVSDILWRNDATGQVGEWLMNNNIPTWQMIGGSGIDHKVVGIGDFDGDGTADVFWRNDATGHTGIWTMNSGNSTWHDLGGSGIDHKVVGIGDFNGDGTSDVFWRNDTTGHVGIWTMNNGTPTWRDLGGSGIDHKVVGIGDFNGDGTADVFWRNDATGHVGIWTMNNGTPTWRDLGGSGIDHKVVGIGDFNGDGTSDILWRNDATGHVGIWTMNNSNPTWLDLGGSSIDHKVVSVGDFNGDGTSDVFWRNDATGHTGIWTMNNGNPTWHDLGGSATDLKVVA